jgi:hypothetical protein
LDSEIRRASAAQDAAMGRLSDHLQVVGRVDDHLKAGAHQLLVIGEQHSHRHRLGSSGRRARTR